MSFCCRGSILLRFVKFCQNFAEFEGELTDCWDDDDGGHDGDDGAYDGDGDGDGDDDVMMMMVVMMVMKLFLH